MFVNEFHETVARPERAYLVGVRDGEVRAPEAESLLRELAGLASTLGLETVGSMLVGLRIRTAATLLGSGKVEEIIAAARAVGADSIIFDKTISPVQQRNWETLSGLRVYDRAELIIDIFGSRAHTREAVLQVELARLRYSLPRLAHSYGELHRQRGGSFGTKGAGEQKIELDRRHIAKKITDIEDELEVVRKSRATQRKKRERLSLKRAAIVGYTNSGKSSLLNAIASTADVLAEDKLFATLDPTTRRLDTGSGAVLVTDTVGFVRNLPHGLVEAFKATLEEAADADLLVHVVDVADPECDIQYGTTLKVLSEIGADISRSLLVYNKIDKLADRGPLEAFSVAHDGALFVSARTGEGLPELVKAIESRLTADEDELTLRVPPADYAIVSLLYREGSILSEDHDGEATILRCKVPDRLLSRVERFRYDDPE
ncbi:MAG: GTPase HflX [Spirochaetes bacterium GWB1_59_5]|nr:MAG: GTPase HflX [Spirochaetes bacterium GWB1_59_5]